MKWRDKPLHPFLLAAYPILTLAASNAREIPPLTAWRALLFVEFAAIFLVVGLKFAYRSWQTGGILSSALIMLFFSYGHVYYLIEDFAVGDLIIGRHRFLMLIWIVSAIGAIILLRRAKSPFLQRTTNFMNVFSLVAILFPVWSIVAFGVRQQSSQAYASSHSTSDLEYSMQGDPPDVYYIILDSYGREDVLQDLFGIDNAEFINALQERGFYVADASVSNHVATGFSLVSSLNLDYAQELGIELPPNTYPGPLIESIRNNVVRTELEALGYSTVALSTGWRATTLVDADYLLTPEMLVSESGFEFQLNDFETLLLETTAALMPLDYFQRQGLRSKLLGLAAFSGWEGRRQLILASFEHLNTVSDIPGPKFIFAHIISPHRPYLFRADGEPVAQSGPSTFEDVGSKMGRKEESQYYHDQMIYINTLTLQAIDSILAKSVEEPIIILQSDTGPAFGFDWEDPDTLNLRSKIAILNAYYFPNGCDRFLYPTISPVNTFRVLFNCYFEGNYELLSDRTYFTNHNSKDGYQFIPLELLLDSGTTDER